MEMDFPRLFSQLLLVVLFPSPALPPHSLLPNWSTPSRARRGQGEHRGHIPAVLLGLVFWLFLGACLGCLSPQLRFPSSSLFT